jgi:hypothetical protein
VSNDIKVGDVCEVIDACCAVARRQYAGKEVTIVARAPLTFMCFTCGFSTLDYFYVAGPALPVPPPGSHYAAPRVFLRKKPPKQNDDAGTRLEHVPAEPDFVEDLQRRLNKAKATEPA